TCAIALAVGGARARIAVSDAAPVPRIAPSRHVLAKTVATETFGGVRARFARTVAGAVAAESVDAEAARALGIRGARVRRAVRRRVGPTCTGAIARAVVAARRCTVVLAVVVWVRPRDDRRTMAVVATAFDGCGARVACARARGVAAHAVDAESRFAIA